MQEAEQLGVKNGLSTRHLLLGLLYDRQSRAVRVLEKLGMSVERVRTEIEKQASNKEERPLPIIPDDETLTTGEPYSVPGTPLTSERAKAVIHRAVYEAVTSPHYYFRPANQVIVLSYERARSLGNFDRIDTEHLLVALAMENRGLAYRALTNLGIDAEKICQALKQLAAEDTGR